MNSLPVNTIICLYCKKTYTRHWYLLFLYSPAQDPADFGFALSADFHQRIVQFQCPFSVPLENQREYFRLILPADCFFVICRHTILLSKRGYVSAPSLYLFK